jgi:uncharacterized protein
MSGAGDHPSTLAVIGGTGRTGRHVVEQALAAGHRIRLLTRDPSGLQPARGLDAVLGHPTDPGAVRETARGADLLVDVLGYDGGIAEPQDVRRRAARAIARVAEHDGPRRLVVVASAAVLPAGDRLRGEEGGPAYRYVFEDHRGVLRVLEDSGLDWTLVCPPDIPDGPPSGRALIAHDAHPEGAGGRITTGELARVVLELALDPDAQRGRVGVAEPRE